MTCISEERREEAINRLLKPAAPPDSGNGVVVPHEAPDGPPKPKKKGKKCLVPVVVVIHYSRQNEPNSTCVLAVTAPRGRLACTQSLERHTAGCVPIHTMLRVLLYENTGKLTACGSHLEVATYEAPTLVHFGAVVADAPSPLSTPRCATGQAQLRLGKPLCIALGQAPTLSGTQEE